MHNTFRATYILPLTDLLTFLKHSEIKKKLMKYFRPKSFTKFLSSSCKRCQKQALLVVFYVLINLGFLMLLGF